MTASKGTQIADAAHELYQLVKQNCPDWYTEPGREFADDDFVARYWRHNLRAAKDMLNYAEELEGWLYEKAELPVPDRRDESSFEPFWWEPPQSDNLKSFLAGEMSEAQIQSVQAGKISL